MQSDFSSGLRLIKALDQRIAQTPTLYLRLGSHVDEQKRTVSILDWIAAYFTDGNNSAAAAMSVDETTEHVTLHIACNNGPPSAENLQKATMLAEAIQTLAGQRKPFIDNTHGHIGYNVVRKLLIDMCWPAVWNKILAVQSILQETGAMNRFDAMIKKWSDYCGNENRPFNCSSLLNDKSNGIGDAHTLKSLLNELKDIVEETDEAKSAHTDGKLKAFNASGVICEDLLYSDIIMSALYYCDRIELPENSGYVSYSFDVGEHKPKPKADAMQRTEPKWMATLSIDELRLLQRFVDAVQELYQYTNGALMLASNGAKFFRALWGAEITAKPFSDLFTVAWVHIEYRIPHGIPCKFNALPMDWATDEIKAFATDDGKPTEEEQRLLNERCKSLWKKDDLISGTLHEEMAMAQFLLEKKISVHHGAIGISSPPCYVCGLVYEELTHSFCIRKKSHTISTDWTLPALDSSERLRIALCSAQTVLCEGFSSIANDFLKDSLRKLHPHLYSGRVHMLSSLTSAPAC